MSKPKLTEWFPANVTPSRVGVYEREYLTDHAFSMWDGRQWKAGSFEADLAGRRTTKSWNQKLPWRGLASDPNARGSA